MARSHSHAPHHPLDTPVVDLVQHCVDAGAHEVDVAVEFAGASSWVRVAASAAGAAVDLQSGQKEPEPAAPVPVTTPEPLDVLCAGLSLGSAVHLETEPGSAVVLVEGLHEVLAYKRQEGRVIEAVLARMCLRIGHALGLAFHRHIAGAGRRTPLALTLNAAAVESRDPFALPGPAVRLRRRELPFVVHGRVDAVGAIPHVLSAGADDPLGGRQGFFVYLRDRLVQSGGWSRLSVADRDDGGLARVAIDLPPAAAAEFAWEAAPRRVLFPLGLAPALRALAFEAVNTPLGAAPTTWEHMLAERGGGLP